MLDRAISILLIAVCSIMYRVSGEYPAGGDYFPKFSLAVIMALAALMLVLSFRSGRKQKEEKPFEISAKTTRPAILAVLFLVYLLIYPTVGFYVSTALFAAVSMAFLKERRLKLYLIVIPALTLALYGFFGLLLDVPFPDSWLI